MFNNGITPEALPERVYQMCKIIASRDISTEELYEDLEPSSINTDQSYRKMVKDAALDLGLIRENEEKRLVLNVDKKFISSLESFRQYCNSVIWKDRSSLFYKMVVAFIGSQGKFLQYTSITDPIVIKFIQDTIGNSNADIKKMRGIRFWIEFLGLGYIQENGYIYYLPNMYVALKDFLSCLELEKGKEYTVREFITNISSISNVAFENIGNSKDLNLALSNGLRVMHDKGEIQLVKNLDSEETWNLYKLDVHASGNSITHIIFKGIK